MIFIRDWFDVETLQRKVMQGDILEIYNIQYDVSKYYWVYNDILTSSLNDGEYADYCYESEFRRDLRMALLEPDRYFIKLVTDVDVEVVRADEEIRI